MCESFNQLWARWYSCHLFTGRNFRVGKTDVFVCVARARRDWRQLGEKENFTRLC